MRAVLPSLSAHDFLPQASTATSASIPKEIGWNDVQIAALATALPERRLRLPLGYDAFATKNCESAKDVSSQVDERTVPALHHAIITASAIKVVCR